MAERRRRLAIIGGVIALEERKKKRVWCKNWYLERNKYSHMYLLKELEVREPGDLYNYLRMDMEAFETLLQLIEPVIERKNTQMRQSVSARERLTATLRYLATGRTYVDMKFSCAISPQLLGKLIPETCRELFKALKNEFLKEREHHRASPQQEYQGFQGNKIGCS
ncbi:hypothetical protein ACJJTC_018245 [Scirpophaga incertulas]